MSPPWLVTRRWPNKVCSLLFHPGIARVLQSFPWVASTNIPNLKIEDMPYWTRIRFDLGVGLGRPGWCTDASDGHTYNPALWVLDDEHSLGRVPAVFLSCEEDQYLFAVLGTRDLNACLAFPEIPVCLMSGTHIAVGLCWVILGTAHLVSRA